MTQRTKKQHLVPKFYLDKFCDPSGFVWTYTADREPLPRKPENTATETNFYTPLGADGERIDRGEDILGEIESGAAPLWDAVASGESLSEEDRYTFSFFLAAQYLRSPGMVRAGAEMSAYFAYQISRFTAMHEPAHEQLMDEYEAEEGVKTSPDERKRIREFINDPNNFTLGVRRSVGLPVLASTQKLAAIFLDMNWSVGVSEDQHFVTSDCPVIRISDPKTHHPLMGDGAFANTSVRVYFPLSPSRILQMTWQGEESKNVISVPRRWARMINVSVVDQAERFVFACKSDSGIVKLCNKRLDGAKRPKIAPSEDTPKIEVKRSL